MRDDTQTAATDGCAPSTIDARLTVSHPVIDAWLTAVNACSVGDVSKLYAPDAILLPTLSGELCDTPEQIRLYFEHFLGRPDFKAELQSCYVQQYSEIKIDSGIYRFNWCVDGKPFSTRARFTFVIRNDLIVEHHSSLVPPGESSGERQCQDRLPS